MSKHELTTLDNAIKAVRVDILKIRSGDNDRTKFNENDLRDLAESIDENGLVQPPSLRPNGDSFDIVAGERRIRACRDILGWTAIDAIILDGIDDQQASAVMLAENTSRVNLNPIDEANAYQKRLDNGVSLNDLSRQAGVSVRTIKDRIKLLSLAPDIQHLVAVGQLKLGHALAMVDLDNNRQRIAVRHAALPLVRFAEKVSELYQAQLTESQVSMFAFELKSETVPARPSRGRRAVTGARTSHKLPPVRIISKKESLGDWMARYIQDLENAGHDSSAVGNLYNALVLMNRTCAGQTLPYQNGTVEKTTPYIYGGKRNAR